MTTTKLICNISLVFFVFILFSAGLARASSISLSLSSYDSEIYKYGTVNIPIVVTASNISGNAEITLTPRTGLSCDTCTQSYTFSGGTNEQGTVTFTLTGTQTGTYNPPFISISASSGSTTATPLTTGSAVTVVERPTWTKSFTASSSTINTSSQVTVTLTLTPSGTFEGVVADLTIPGGWTLVSGADPRTIGTISGESSYQWILSSDTSTGSKTVSVAISATNPSESSSENTESLSITVGEAAAEEETTTSTGSTSSGGGGGGGIASDTYWSNTYTVNDSLLAKGYTRKLEEKQRVKLLIGGESHYVGVVGLTKTQATINVSSRMQQAIFNIGQTRKFELTDDGYYDLSVRLNSIANNTASLTVLKINEQIATSASSGEESGSQDEGLPAGEELSTEDSCVPSWNCGEWSECADGIKARVCTDSNGCGTAEGKPDETTGCSGSLSLAVLIAILLAIALLAGAVIVMKLKAGKEKPKE